MELAGKSFCSQLLRYSAQRYAGVGASRVSNANFSRTASASQLNRRTELDYEELSDLMTFDEDVALIDVRSPNELCTYGSIPGAINIPLSEVKAALLLPEQEFRNAFLLNKPAKNAKSIVFFARGPNASSAAVEIAHKLGFKGSRQYTGGWEDYCKMTGVPMKKNEPRSQQSEAKTSQYMNQPSFNIYKSFSV